ncbi:MAG: tyrosine-type recombinase/integrase [Candidatus Bathyarchaeia archaeon]
MNPGSPTPQAGILNQAFHPTPEISTNQAKDSRRLPQEVTYQEQINKTVEKATAEGKAKNTQRKIYYLLRQLSKVSDLMNPDDVKKAIAYAKITDAAKTCHAFAYEWFTKANGLQWQKPRFKWNTPTPIIPTTQQVERIISASTPKFSTIFKLMAETGVEGEELHRTHRNQYDPTQNIISIKGLKGHASANYKLKTETAQLLREYMAKYQSEHPFPQPKVMSQMWIKARTKASKIHNDPTLTTIPMKNLRNYSGAQFYHRTKDPIGVMRHLRHKKLETTMHYIRAINLDEEEYTCRTAKTVEEATQLIEAGYQYVTEIDGTKLFRKRK